MVNILGIILGIMGLLIIILSSFGMNTTRSSKLEKIFIFFIISGLLFLIMGVWIILESLGLVIW